MRWARCAKPSLGRIRRVMAPQCSKDCRIRMHTVTRCNDDLSQCRVKEQQREIREKSRESWLRSRSSRVNRSRKAACGYVDEVDRREPKYRLCATRLYTIAKQITPYRRTMSNVQLHRDRAAHKIFVKTFDKIFNADG